MRDNDFFTRPVDEYVRNTDLLGTAIRHLANYLSVETGDSLEETTAYAEMKIKETAVDPKIKFLGRNAAGDREKMEGTFGGHIQDVYDKGRILAPNLHVYENPEVLESTTVSYILEKFKRRSAQKELEREAQMAGDTEKEDFHASAQTTIKRFLNTISGAHASPYTPIFNNTAHTTLTSITRCSTSTSNGLAERLLGGGRAYSSEELTIQDLTASITLADEATVKLAMEENGLLYPTADQLLSHVLRSFKVYSRNTESFAKIENFIRKLKDWQLAVCMFTYDLEGLKVVNREWTKDFILGLSLEAEDEIEDWSPWVKGAQSTMKDQITMILSSRINGRKFSDVQKEDPETMRKWAATCRKNERMLAERKTFIKAFMQTDFTIISVWDIPNMQRRIVPLSDTDSTFFICQDWVEFCAGSLDFGPLGRAIASTIMFLDVAILRHLLALTSCQMGVSKEHLFLIAMKSEFFMSVVGVTNIAKHYSSSVVSREGEVFPKPKLDTKGVNMKSSRMPKEVISSSDEYIEYIYDCVTAGRKMHPEEVLRLPVSWAHEINSATRNGRVDYLVSAKVKEPESYSNPEEAAATKQHNMWMQVFAPDYGEPDARPYGCLKVPVNKSSPKLIKDWLDKCPAPFQSRMQAYLDANDIKSVNVIYLPAGLVKDGKMPLELHLAVDAAHLENETTRSFQLTLEKIGIYVATPKNTRYLSVEFPKTVNSRLFTREELRNGTYVLD